MSSRWTTSKITLNNHRWRWRLPNLSRGAATMLMPGKPDSYNSVRLLSDHFLQRLREAAQGDLAVGVPGRDLFIAVSMKNPEVVNQVRNKVVLDYQQTDHPLTDRLLLIHSRWRLRIDE